MKLSFVIPCYRSEKTIRGVVDEIISTVAERGDDYEIIMVSDSSPDNVYHVIEEMCGENPRLKGVELAKNFGQEAATMAGYSKCTGDIIVSVDDDGQMPVNETYKLIDKLNEGYDIVYGTYAHKMDSWFRNFGSRVNDRMAEWLINKPKDVKITSFFCVKKFIVDEMLRYDRAFPYIVGLVFRSTQSVGNVPVTHRARKVGKSGYTLSKLIGLWMNGFTSFSIKPLRISTFLGCFTAVVGFIIGIIMVIQKLIDPSIAAGYTSLIAALLFIGGLIMIMLGLIGEYIGRIFISINNSPQFVVRKTTNFDENKQNAR